MKKYIYGILVLAVALGAILFLRARAQQCTTTSGSQLIGYLGSDPNTYLNLGTLEGVDNDTQQLLLRLHYLGANFSSSAGYPNTTNHRMSAAAADFNGDGMVDLAEGGEVCDYNTVASLGNTNRSDSNLSIFISRGKDPGDPTKFYFPPPSPYYILYNPNDLSGGIRTYRMFALGAGDVDGDGDNDILAIAWSGKLYWFKNLFSENNLAPGGPPVFNPTPTLVMDVVGDGQAEFANTSMGNWHHRKTSAISVVDIDHDGDKDLIIGLPTNGGLYGQVVILFNNGSGTFSRRPGAINPYAGATYGVCGAEAADFDHDGDIDFIVASVHSTDVYLYINDGLGNFTKVSTPVGTVPLNHGAPEYFRAGDFDNDGFSDFVLGTDAFVLNPQNHGGFVFWFNNNRSSPGNFTRNCLSNPPSCSTPTSPSNDLDSGAVGDFDGDGDVDFFVADGNQSQNVYFFMNEIYPLYVDRGTASSRNILPCTFLISDNAVVSATIHVQENKPPQTNITYYLANSDNADGTPYWEGPVTPDVEFNFANPGSFLRWQAVFESTDEHVTPKLSRLTLDYKYIGKREYSRTSQAVTMADVNSSHPGDEEVLYSASFEFPKWRGHLRSWDVNNLNLGYSQQSQLQDIVNAGASFVQDGGEILATRTWQSRVAYAAYDQGGDGIMNDRVRFNTDAGNMAILDDYLGLGQGSPEIQPLIQFVLGEDPSAFRQGWKLGDINHSSPQALEPPTGNPATMGSGYDAFKTANANRQRAILVGANDGMLHCFDPATMEEMWGFIPNNLLYKLKLMRVVDPDCGVFLAHQFFVDATPVIRDVYFSGTWHTIVICGQGAGWGKNHNWYYFCLDVTVPDAPMPLWELTESHMGETWSVPAIGKIQSTGQWVAFFGSGYDSSNPHLGLGNYFYAVDIATGQILKSMPAAETPDPASPFSIQNTLPGSAVLVDRDLDGNVESAYFGDLLGRLWKIDLTQGIAQWAPTVIYRDPNHYPIITKPAVYLNPTDASVHLHFGTGGDDKAGDTAYYSFISLKDGNPATVDWFMGPDALAGQLGINLSLKRGQFAQGEKIWADDVISDRICYIATLTGSIESLNPCNTLTGVGNIYARNVTGTQTGGSALLGPGGTTIEYLQTAQKVRSAVTIGGTQQLTQSGQSNVNVRKVYIQSYTQPSGGIRSEPPSQVLVQPIPQNSLIIKSWREIYKIIR